MRVALSYLEPLRIRVKSKWWKATPYMPSLSKNMAGVHHFQVLVEDMQAAIAQAEQVGVIMTQDGSGFGADGDGHYAYLNTEGKIGTTIELIQRPKGEGVFRRKKSIRRKKFSS